MGFTKITSVSLTDLFVQQIENMILSGELAVGEQLPPARELSVKMGVSRPVISAGLVELEKLGFVEIVPRQGVYVSDYRRKGTVETLVAIMRHNSGGMRKDEVRSLLEVREAMESLCSRLVVQNASDEELDRLGVILDEMQETKDADEAAEIAFRFYHEMAVMSGNVLLPLLYHSFRAPGIYLWTVFCKRSGVQAFYELKLSFYRTLLNRDVNGAVNCVHMIMENALNNLGVYGV